MKVYHFERDLSVKLRDQIKQIKKELPFVVYASSDGRTITVIANEQEDDENDAG